MESEQCLHQWVIYWRPRDFPDRCVVRRWTIGRQVVADAEPWSLSDTIEEARTTLPDGLVCLPRMENDDSTIVEVWT